MLYSAVQYSAMLYSAVQYSAMLCSKGRGEDYIAAQYSEVNGENTVQLGSICFRTVQLGVYY